MSSNNSNKGRIGRTEIRQKKKYQQYRRRFQSKRKRSLVSLPSTSSMSSNFADDDHNIDEKYIVPQFNSSSIYDSTSIPSSLFTATFDNTDLESPSDNETDVPIGESTTSSTSLNNDSSDNESNISNEGSFLPDHRRLYASTNATIYQFSLDVLEFCRMSRLPRNQRIHLLELFNKYMPQPNLVPKSCTDLFSKFTI